MIHHPIQMMVHVIIIQAVQIQQHLITIQPMIMMMVVVHIVQAVQIQEHLIMIHQQT